MNVVEGIQNSQVRLLIENEARSINIKYYFIIALGFETGLRISDILNLKGYQVFNKVIKVIESKTKKKREFTITKPLQEEIIKYAKENELLFEEYLFPSSRNNKFRHLSRQQVWKITKDIESKLDLHKFAPHSLRKSFAYTVASENNIEIARRALNHKYTSTTLGYVFSNTNFDQLIEQRPSTPTTEIKTKISKTKKTTTIVISMSIIIIVLAILKSIFK
jgi:integrase